jgi:hypothetical protein
LKGKMGENSARVLTWWLVLSGVCVMNLIGWVWATLRRPPSGPGAMAARRPRPERAAERTRRWQLVLAGVFVVGCAFRSILPRSEGLRTVLFDWTVSSAAWGRAVATVAELALVAQWTLLLRACAAGTPTRTPLVASRLLLPLIVMAELCSWYSALTTNFLGSVFEESLWAITSTLLLVSCLVCMRYHGRALRRFLTGAILVNAFYVTFMWSVDVPMYWARWQGDQAVGKQYLTLAEGLRDAQDRRVVTWRWEDWRREMPWMSLYFAGGGWISLGLAMAPRPSRRGALAARRQVRAVGRGTTIPRVDVT